MSPDIKPYQTLSDTHFPGDTVIDISKAIFEGVEFTDGKSTFSFIRCKFDELSFSNVEDIPFQDISFSFIDCTIKHIANVNMISRNISLYFGNTKINGVIRNENLRHVEINQLCNRWRRTIY